VAKGFIIVLLDTPHDQSGLRECIAVLHEHPVLFVRVDCPLEELERREQQRGDRRLGQARTQFGTIHGHGVILPDLLPVCELGLVTRHLLSRCGVLPTKLVTLRIALPVFRPQCKYTVSDRDAAYGAPIRGIAAIVLVRRDDGLHFPAKAVLLSWLVCIRVLV
jgi:hypothetical protein